MLENDAVNLIKKDKKLLIKKRILIPFSKDELQEQHDFVNYLYDNNIKVARILGQYKYNGNLYEYQEYIKPDDNPLDINDMIKSISLFHECSKEYDKELSKKSTYDMNFECNDYRLKKLIVGYEDKYNKYPLENYTKYKDKMGFNSDNKYDEILCFYNYCYNYIKNKYKEPSCIIHNDITKNNVLSHDNSLYLIDFDFCIKSYEVVDVTDIIVSKYYGLDNILKNYEEIKKVVKNAVIVYNECNNIGMCYEDILYQMFLKIVSYNCYVVLNENTRETFDNNFNQIHKIMKLVKEG